MERFLEPTQSGVYTLGILDRVDGEDVFLATNGKENIHLYAVDVANCVGVDVATLLNSHAKVRIEVGMFPAIFTQEPVRTVLDIQLV